MEYKYTVQNLNKETIMDDGKKPDKSIVTITFTAKGIIPEVRISNHYYITPAKIHNAVPVMLRTFWQIVNSVGAEGRAMRRETLRKRQEAKITPEDKRLQEAQRKVSEAFSRSIQHDMTEN